MGAEIALGFQPLWPLRGATVGEAAEICAVLACGHELLFAIDIVREDHFFSMPVKAMINALLLLARLAQHFAIHRCTCHEAVACIVDFDEATGPYNREPECFRIKDSGFVIEPHTNTLGQGEPGSFKDATEKTAVITRAEAPIFPGHLIVLIAPVPLIATIDAREGGDQRWQGLLLHEVERLLAVIIKDAVSIDKLLPMLVVLLLEWRAIRGERCGIRRFDDGHGGTEVVEVPKSDGVVHPQTWRIPFARFHDAA